MNQLHRLISGLSLHTAAEHDWFLCYRPCICRQDMCNKWWMGFTRRTHRVMPKLIYQSRDLFPSNKIRQALKMDAEHVTLWTFLCIL